MDIDFRRWTLEDSKYIVKYCNVEELGRQIINKNFPSPYSLKDAEFYITEVAWKIEVEDVRCIVFDWIPVWTIWVMHKSWYEAHIKEIGFWLGSGYHWKWIMTYAVSWIIKYIKKTYPECTKLMWWVMDGNIASCKVQENCWFVREWVLRNHLYLAEDVWTWKSWFYDKILYWLVL